MKDNIVLIGMPGAGKSTIGVILAKILGYRFLDSDLLIQEQTGKLLKEIIAESGEEGFLAIEGAINAGIQTRHSIIATGGSVVYEENAMSHLKEIGTIIYLDVSYEELNTRLSNLTARGVVLQKGQSLQDLYQERLPLYQKYADITIVEDHQTTEETIQAILDAISDEV